MCIICILNFKSLPNLRSCTWGYYLQQPSLYIKVLIHSALRLYFDWSSRSLYVFFMIKNIWFGVVKGNLEPRTHLCWAWNGQTAISGVFLRSPVILGTVISKQPCCFSWLGVSTVQPALPLPGWLIHFWGLLPHWGTGGQTPRGGFRGLSRDIWCGWGCSGQPSNLQGQTGRRAVDACTCAGTEQSTPQRLVWPPHSYPGVAESHMSSLSEMHSERIHGKENKRAAEGKNGKETP